ncbi:hypothetical protein LCGC14_1540870 [marine sediment metagenome]|uniref:Uncharacterized protein n=1 Tax=marine sediment metagenome TaxID=412755 RepID=A0A0F9IT54_9ZZZZ
MLLAYPRFKGFDPNTGALLAAGKVYSYIAGTSTPTPTYTNQALSVANPNPTELDGSGEATIWLDPAVNYKIVLADPYDVVLFTVDGIQTPEAARLASLVVSGATTLAAVTVSGQIISTVTTGTAPLVIASTTEVANLNAAKLSGKDWDAPDPIGATTPNSVKATTIEASGDITPKANVSQESANAGKWIRGQISEEITLSTGGATTDSAANLLPANSIIEGVVARVTETITTATDWALGDASQAARFLAASTNLTLGDTEVGLAHRDPTVASADLGPVQSAAASLRITTSGTPGAGKIRLTVFFSQFVAPGS